MAECFLLMWGTDGRNHGRMFPLGMGHKWQESWNQSLKASFRCGTQMARIMAEGFL